LSAPELTEYLITFGKYSGLITSETISCVRGLKTVTIAVMISPHTNPYFHDI